MNYGTKIDYIKILNNFVKQSQEKTKDLIMISEAEGRYFIKFQVAIDIIYRNLEEHINIWEQEIKNGGFINLYYKNLVLKQMYNLCKKIKNKFLLYKVDGHDISKINSTTISMFNKISYSVERVSPNSSKHKDAINAKVEEMTLPKNFLETFTTIMFVVYELKNLEETIKKYNLEKETNSLVGIFDKYEKFIDKEIIATRGFKEFKDYEESIDKMIFDTRRDKIMRGIKAYKERMQIA